MSSGTLRNDVQINREHHNFCLINMMKSYRIFRIGAECYNGINSLLNQSLFRTFLFMTNPTSGPGAVSENFS